MVKRGSPRGTAPRRKTEGGEYIKNWHCMLGRRGSSVVEDLCTDLEVPGSILMLGSWIMKMFVLCILLLEWSTTSLRLWVLRMYHSYDRTRQADRSRLNK